MADELFKRILDEPLVFAVALAVVVLALGLFIQMAGSPLEKIINFLREIIPVAFKEIRGKAGATGVVDIIIIILTSILAITMFVNPSIANAMGFEGAYAFIPPFLVLVVAAVVFIISLYNVKDLETFKDLYK